MKQFIYFFLSVEIASHATAASIDQSKYAAEMFKNDLRVGKAAADLFATKRDTWKTLKARFVWCTLCVWSQLDDTDVAEFVRLKKIRDDIAHGSIAAPPAEAVTAIKRLATKLYALDVKRTV